MFKLRFPVLNPQILNSFFSAFTCNFYRNCIYLLIKAIFTLHHFLREEKEKQPGRIRLVACVGNDDSLVTLRRDTPMDLVAWP